MEPLVQAALFEYVRTGGPLDYARYDAQTQERMREVGVRNLFLQKRLTDLTAALAGRGVTPVILKGAHLMQTVYPFGIRPVEDIDILMDPADLTAVDAVLRTMGYVQDMTGLDAWTHIAVSHKLTYVNDAKPLIPIDVHFRLGPYPYLGRIDLAALLAHTEILQTPAGPLRVLQPEMLLVHLCLHLYQHHFDTWQVSCCDIAAVLRHSGDRFDWAKFWRLVESHRLGLPVHYSLGRAQELTQMEIPTSTEVGMKSPGRFERWVYRTSRRQGSKSDRYFLQFITTPGLRVKAGMLLRIVLPSRWFLQANHGGSYLRYVAHVLKTALRLTRSS